MIMNITNQKIIDAVIQKAEKVCPNSLALIGVYGSVITGDEYDKSDLDLLILIEDDNGWKLGTGFILDDSQIGYDIYCTTLEGLKYDAECYHAYISKLMDSEIVYVKNQILYQEVLKLREQTKLYLVSEERYNRVNELIEKAKVSFANSYLHEDIGQVRLDGCIVVNYLLSACMIYYGTYFKRGIKKTFEELGKLPLKQEFLENIKKVSMSKDVFELRNLLRNLILYLENHTKKEAIKKEPSNCISGTYEEIFSNWKNKVDEAAVNNDAFSTFMNMCNFQYMVNEIASEYEIGTYKIMEEYNPDCLEANKVVFNKYLRKYEDIYNKAGISVKRFIDVDSFIFDYLDK